MSYRTYINDTQIFGNNEGYEEWFDFIKSQGIKVGEEAEYDGYITDLQGMFNVIDKITERLIKERHEKVEKGLQYINNEPYPELTDLSYSFRLYDKTPLLWINMQLIRQAYCFLPYQVFMAVEDVIEKADEPYIGDKEWYCCSYKLKEGKKIHVHAG